METDIYKFIKLYNKDIEFCSYCNEIILKKHKTCLMSHGGHTVLLYKNDNGDIEKYDSGNRKNKIQWTSNNCTLFAGIVGIIRPLVKNMKIMMQILKMVSDKPHTKSCKKMIEISQHYFNRGIEYFNYGNPI